MSKYCEQCGAELEDNNKFCSKCGTKYEEDELKSNAKEKKVLGGKKKNLLIGVGIFAVILIIVGNVSGFFSGFKKGEGKVEKPKTESKNEMGLKRISKEYEYNLVGKDIQQCDEWFVASNELFGILDEKLYHLNQKEAILEEVGDMGGGKYIPYSGQNKWLVFTDSDHIYKYNIQSKSVDVIMSTENVGSAVVVDNVLYYYSEKEREEWTKMAQESESYVPPFSGSEYTIWSFDLESNSDKKVIENVMIDTTLVADLVDNRYFYFSMPGSDGEKLARYDCKKQTEEVINENISSRSLVAYNGNCYSFDEDILLVKEGKETCLKENAGNMLFVEGVTCVGNYVVCEAEGTEEIVVLDGENVYEIEKTWLEDWDSGVGEVIFAQNERIWFCVDEGVYFVDFDGNISKEKEWIGLEDGESVACFNNELWVFGQPQEKWKINKEIDNSVVDEIEKQGYDVASFGQYDNGNTELTMNVGEYGLYKIPLPETKDIDKSDKKNESQSQDDKLYQQKKELDNKKKSVDNSGLIESNATGIDKNIADLIMYFPGFSGVWGDFGVHADPYQGMIEQAIKSKIRLSDYFGGDVNEVSLDISVFQWDGVNVVGAGCILTFEGPSPGNGKFRTLTGVVNVDESGELEFVEGEYY